MNSKKNSFRGNYMRKYGMYLFYLDVGAKKKKKEAQIDEHCQHDNMLNIYLGKVVASYVFFSL